MGESVEQILRKIHFVERDIELHKHILMAIPQDQPEEMEKVVRDIARMGVRLDGLKRSIAEIDPEMHAQIMQLEEGTRKFKALAAVRKFQQVFTLDQLGECMINLINGTQVECLVKAQDDTGGWAGLTHDGQVVEYAAEEVMGS